MSLSSLQQQAHVLATRAWKQLDTTAVIVLCKLPLHCNIGSQSQGVFFLGWLMTCLCRILSLLSFVVVLFTVIELSFITLCSLVFTEILSLKYLHSRSPGDSIFNKTV